MDLELNTFFYKRKEKRKRAGRERAGREGRNCEAIMRKSAGQKNKAALEDTRRHGKGEGPQGGAVTPKLL